MSNSAAQKELQSGQNKAPVGPPCMLDRIARIVAKEGLETEKQIKEVGSADPKRLSFLWSRDPYHALYKQKIAEYIESPPLNEPVQPDRFMDPPTPLASRDPPISYENPYRFKIRIPEGMTRKELGIVKFTAQFVARYGIDFLSVLGDAVSNETQFQFLKRPRDTSYNRYSFFTQLLVDYANLIMPYSTQPKKSDTALMEAVLEGFFASFDAFKKSQEEEDEVVHKVETDRSDFVVSDEYFVDIENKDLPPPEHLVNRLPMGILFVHWFSTWMQPPPSSFPPPPEPKRHKFDESALVPEEEFLAQHPGWSTITVLVTRMRVIQIIVPSLSENVASLKEKIAQKIRIPANQHKLIGKTGVLKDDMSLAYYNLRAGEMLTLTF